MMVIGNRETIEYYWAEREILHDRMQAIALGEGGSRGHGVQQWARKRFKTQIKRFLDETQWLWLLGTSVNIHILT